MLLCGKSTKQSKVNIIFSFSKYRLIWKFSYSQQQHSYC